MRMHFQKSKLVQGGNTVQFRFLVIVLLILGIWFRFVNIDQKAYWLDEAFTSLHVSGYPDQEIIQQTYTGHVISVEDLRKYQYPNSETTVADTVKHIAETAPELPPLYFVLLRSWINNLGNSIAITRGFSAALSLLIFPCIYWLCMELFRSPAVGWLAIALVSVSPFSVLYAQEARPYVLWTLTVLLSSASLLRAMRLQTKISWSVYTITIVMGLYTHILTILVLLGQTLYVLVSEKIRWTKPVVNYGLSTLISLIAFLPWILLVLSYKIHNPDHASTVDPVVHVPFTSLPKSLIRGLSLVFVDFNLNDKSSLVQSIPFLLLLLGLMFLIGSSILYLSKEAPKKARLFLLIPMVVSTLPIILLDFVSGTMRSNASRYFVPCYVAIQLTVAFFLNSQINENSVAIRRQRLWRILTIALISIGVFSCLDISQAKSWWSKSNERENHNIANVINQVKQPLIVSDAFFINILAISHYLNANVKLQLVEQPKTLSLSDGFSNIFLYQPSEGLRDRLKATHSIEAVYEPSLWRITKH